MCVLDCCVVRLCVLLFACACVFVFLVVRVINVFACLFDSMCVWLCMWLVCLCESECLNQCVYVCFFMSLHVGMFARVCVCVCVFVCAFVYVCACMNCGVCVCLFDCESVFLISMCEYLCVLLCVCVF